MSEEPPKSNDGPVKIVVASTFNSMVIDNNKDVLIEFYAPWCEHCKEFEPTYNEIAIRAKKLFPNVVVAKLNAIANEIEGLILEGFPTIWFY